MLVITVSSERLLFRTLSEEDATERYLGWFNDPEVNRFFKTRFIPPTLESCRKFVSVIEHGPCNHLLSISDKETLEHLGNIKPGCINTNHQSGQLSLFIGEKAQ